MNGKPWKVVFDRCIKDDAWKERWRMENSIELEKIIQMENGSFHQAWVGRNNNKVQAIYLVELAF